MFALEIMELAVAVLGMVGTGVLIVSKTERMWRLCKAGIRSKRTMTFRLASDLNPVRFAEIAKQQRIAALKS